MGRERTFILPCLTWLFNWLHYISPLTIIGRLIRCFRKSWEESYLAVEIYVVSSLAMLIFLIWLVAEIGSAPLLVLIILSWRLLDISQSWFHTFMKPSLNVLSPVRSLALGTINYLELFVIFGLLAFHFRYHNFYPTFVGITESLRYSIGVITATGSRFDPSSIVGGLLYYSEIAFGLAFLVVIISRVLSLFKDTTR